MCQRFYLTKKKKEKGTKKDGRGEPTHNEREQQQKINKEKLVDSTEVGDYYTEGGTRSRLGSLLPQNLSPPGVPPSHGLPGGKTKK